MPMFRRQRKTKSRKKDITASCNRRLKNLMLARIFFTLMMTMLACMFGAIVYRHQVMFKWLEATRAAQLTFSTLCDRASALFYQSTCTLGWTVLMQTAFRISLRLALVLVTTASD